MIHYGDIRKLNGYDLPIVDVITGGSPCQDLSIACRERKGLSGDRSSLFMEQIRIIKEMRDHDRELQKGKPNADIRPRFMVWENVVGSLSSPGKKNGENHRGEDFQAVLTEIIKIVEPRCPDVPIPNKGRWPKSGCLYDEMGGWSVAWRVHNAEFWGVPQRRKRVALVADFGGLSAPEVLFERKGLQWDTEQGCEIWDKNARYSKTCSRESAVGLDLHHCTITGDVAMSIRSARADPQHQPTLLIKKDNEPTIRRVTPLECERLQAFPDNWTLIGKRNNDGEYYYTNTIGKNVKVTDTTRYKAIGNSIALPFWYWLLKRISTRYDYRPTLGSLFDGIGGFPYCWEQCNGKGTAVWASEIEEFPTAVTMSHFGGDIIL